MAKDALPDLLKLRIKLGAHEFEAEGAPELVAAHLQTWKALIATAPASAPRSGLPPPVPPASDTANLFAVDPQRNLVILQVYPVGTMPHTQAALLLLYAFQQAFGATDRGVEVTRLKAALTASGYSDARVDRTLAQHVSAGLVTKRGRRKGSSYQLTPNGCQRAETLVNALRNSHAGPK